MNIFTIFEFFSIFTFFTILKNVEIFYNFNNFAPTTCNFVCNIVENRVTADQPFPNYLPGRILSSPPICFFSGRLFSHVGKTELTLAARPEKREPSFSRLRWLQSGPWDPGSRGPLPSSDPHSIPVSSSSSTSPQSPSSSHPFPAPYRAPTTILRSNFSDTLYMGLRAHNSLPRSLLLLRVAA